MSFSIDSFAETRPFAYHLTARANVPMLRRDRELHPAAELFRRAHREDLLRVRRRDSLVVAVNGDDIHVRDQAPLHAGNMRLKVGWKFEDFVHRLNQRVFFWPGGAGGPISYGVRHFGRYADDGPALLRIPTAALLAANVEMPPLFCKFNSGSPRCSMGQPSPRDETTFVAASKATFSASQVVELTFAGSIRLPPETQVGASPSGPWKRL